LSQPLLLLIHTHRLSVGVLTEPSSESLVGLVLERPVSVAHSHARRARGLHHVLPLHVGSPQEGDGVRELLGISYLVGYLIFVGDISVQDEGRGIKRCLEGALGGPHSRPELGSVLHAHSLHALTGYRLAGGVLPEEFRVGHGRIIEGHVVVHGAVEILSVRMVPLIVVLGALHVEVGDPSQLAVNVPVFRNFRVVGHARALELVHLVGVGFALGLDQHGLLLLELLVEILAVVGVILLVKQGGAVVEALVPLVFARSQHSVVSVLLNDQF